MAPGSTSFIITTVPLNAGTLRRLEVDAHRHEGVHVWSPEDRSELRFVAVAAGSYDDFLEWLCRDFSRQGVRIRRDDGPLRWFDVDGDPGELDASLRGEDAETRPSLRPRRPRP